MVPVLHRMWSRESIPTFYIEAACSHLSMGAATVASSSPKFGALGIRPRILNIAWSASKSLFAVVRSFSPAKIELAPARKQRACSGMENRVGWKICCSNIVTPKTWSLCVTYPKLLEHSLNPYNFCCSICQCLIFCLSAGT